MAEASRSVRRIASVDVARGVALLAMASFHFLWDLEFFGYLEPGATTHGIPRLYARSIASSFLFLVGVSLVLANGEGVRWKDFWRRLATIAGAAGLITLGTYLALPEEFIFFGILHQIALASLLGLAFLRLPPPLTLLATVLVIAAPYVLRSPVFDRPFLWWVGLSAAVPRSNDYVPLFPWFGAVLAGIAAARLAAAAGVFARLASWTPRRTRPLAFLGRHSLPFYLAHQPVLLAAVWLFAFLAPPEPVTPEVRFMASCERSCAGERDADFCARYCACMLDKVEAGGLMSRVFARQPDDETRTRVSAFAGICSADMDAAP
jgi:uncharacterized membrane protein